MEHTEPLRAACLNYHRGYNPAGGKTFILTLTRGNRALALLTRHSNPPPHLEEHGGSDLGWGGGGGGRRVPPHKSLLRLPAPSSWFARKSRVKAITHKHPTSSSQSKPGVYAPHYLRSPWRWRGGPHRRLRWPPGGWRNARFSEACWEREREREVPTASDIKRLGELTVKC